ncbi:MAG: hypothetical protein COS41_06355 [Elusimicrobia bacterium CG03_land_8_20_14_0_80_50_18]|nr:MAG: hypothetical protein COS41_06355 [Elusimicrobia bacterium CG03_land_8_20_14_0_80_50_18]
MLYKKMDTDSAYRLLNHGPLALVSTRSGRGEYDIAPVMWNCPVNDEPAQLMVAVYEGHKTFKNIRANKEFIISVPVVSQLKLVQELGSVSGKKVNKLEEFDFEYFKGQVIDCAVPAGVLGFAECRVNKIFTQCETKLVIGDIVRAEVLSAALKNDMIRPVGKFATLHHTGSSSFISTKDI